MKRFALLGALVAVLTTVAVGFAGPAASATRTGSVAIPVSTAQSGGALDGVLNVTRFTTDAAGGLVATGTFTGTVTDLATGATQLVTTAFSAPVTAASPSCTILDLTLGPLHLDLLGLVVDLN